MGGSGSHGADSGEVRVGVGFSNKRAALDSGQYCTIFLLAALLVVPITSISVGWQCDLFCFIIVRSISAIPFYQLSEPAPG